jgi:hypothetical protein
VVCLANWIQGVENAAGDPRPKTDWVRTVDGWESRHAVETHSRGAHAELHPGLVAAFLLGASIFSLVAFPARVVAKSTASGTAPVWRRSEQAPAARSAAAG